MPFLPLPASVVEHLSQLDPAVDRALELGSGEGHVQDLIAAAGGQCLGLDLRHPATGTVCDLVGDARRPPVRPGSLKMLVAANLLRHLTPRHRLAEYVNSWRELLAPSGALFILEDEPSLATTAERNFRDLQEFLAQLMPESRGPLLPLARFRSDIAANAPGDWTFGTVRNRERIDATAVVRFLAGGQGTPTGPLATLIRSIGRDGLDPGCYWWACLRPAGE